MKEEVKNLWIEALRSGEYSQTQSTLSDEDGFCCLGVLCEVAIKNGVQIEVKEGDPETGSSRSYDGEQELLPKSVRNWAEMEGNTGDLPERSTCLSLVEMNDDCNKSFKQIAVTIGHYWKEL